MVIHYLGISLPMDSVWTHQPNLRRFYFIKSVFWSFLTKIQQVLGFRSSYEMSKPDFQSFSRRMHFPLSELCVCFFELLVEDSMLHTHSLTSTNYRHFIFSFGCE